MKSRKQRKTNLKIEETKRWKGIAKKTDRTNKEKDTKWQTKLEMDTKK